MANKEETCTITIPGRLGGGMMFGLQVDAPEIHLPSVHDIAVSSPMSLKTLTLLELHRQVMLNRKVVVLDPKAQF